MGFQGSETLSMASSGGHVPRYSGYQPCKAMIVGQRQSAASAHLRPIHTEIASAQSRQHTAWELYDRRPEVQSDTKNYLFAENTKSDDTIFLKFAKQKDVDHRAL